MLTGKRDKGPTTCVALQVVLKKEIGANELKRSRIKVGRQVNKMVTASEQRRHSPGEGALGLQGRTGMRNISLTAEEARATAAGGGLGISVQFR